MIIYFIFNLAAMYAFKKIDITLQHKNLLLDVVEPLTDLHVKNIYSQFLEIYNKESSIDSLKNFKTSLNRIVEHNKNPNKTYTKGLNQYSDMSDQQFSDFFLMKAPQNCSATSNFQFKLSNSDLPEKVDWRNRGGVTPVKNQGHCGSCWTFSTVGSMEAHYLIYKKELKFFAEQQLVDCAQAFDNHGCNGGLPSHAFEYIKYNGITTEQQYPYQAAETGSCKYNKNMAAGFSLNGSFNITAGDEEMLTQALAQVGPVSVAFEVVDGFRDYREGVYTSDVCQNGPSDVNHAVLAVGYGVDKESGLGYYIVKNSWGAEWGDDGYFKIQKDHNMCGISNCNAFPDMGQTNVIRVGEKKVKGILKTAVEI